MTGAQYIVNSLIRKGVTDAFGIPGGVILRLLYAFDSRREEIAPHLSYHEQCAGFAACGYALATGKLGVAYATRGPGFTNLITAIADAYHDALPTLFITAHSSPCPPAEMRTMADQEMDTSNMVRGITKRAVRMDDPSSFHHDFEELCHMALTGRKGPVFMDVSTHILDSEVGHYTEEEPGMTEESPNPHEPLSSAAHKVAEAIRTARRPILLIGDGINQAQAREPLNTLARKAGIPVLSSRFTHDMMDDRRLYYGYIGSHGCRCANFILSKTDLIVSMGNRLHFPLLSVSFRSVTEHAQFIRCEIDKHEFLRDIPHAVNLHADVKALLGALNEEEAFGQHDEWVDVCDTLRTALHDIDSHHAVRVIAEVLRSIPGQYSIVNDVGNHEFWVSQACVMNGVNNRTYYSKSFAPTGSGLGKAIGVCYATHRPVVCFVGDQGLQMNIQELQYIAQHTLPIMVVLVNNHSSGMIKDREAALYDKFVHTTPESGFLSPSFPTIAAAYGIDYVDYARYGGFALPLTGPLFVELPIDQDTPLWPTLPKGNRCQDMAPYLPREKYEKLDQL